MLDLYAGSGALAIEALSRGAASAVLVDSDLAAAAAIRANLETTGFGDAARVERISVERVRDGAASATPRSTWCSSTLPTTVRAPR